LTDWRQVGSGVVDITFAPVVLQAWPAGVPDQPCGQGAAGLPSVGSARVAEVP